MSCFKQMTLLSVKPAIMDVPHPAMAGADGHLVLYSSVRAVDAAATGLATGFQHCFAKLSKTA